MSSFNSEPIRRRALHERLAEQIRGMITTGHLRSGQKISERELCERFKVSRTPLREALKVLASEGAVRLLPNRGAVVNTLTIRTLEELFLVGGAIEALSGEVACEQITDREIVEIRKMHNSMVEQWRRGNQQRYAKLNLQIHEAIREITRNETLKSVYRALPGYVLTARFANNFSPERWARAVKEHEDMMEALAARDGAKLGSLLREHLANKLANVKDWLAQNNAETATPIPVRAARRRSSSEEGTALATRARRRSVRVEAEPAGLTEI
jgi:DNA-binding GntR family transcriptional regulator